MNPDLVIFSFSNESVRNLDFTGFLKRFGESNLPDGDDLKALQGKLLIAIEGYDDDSREVYAIPEARRFYQHLHDVFPAWLYFINLQTDNLKAMQTCLLASLTSIKRDGSAQVQVVSDPVELIRLIGRQFMSMNVMCERAGMTEEEIYNLSRDVFHYFGLPYGDEETGGS